DRFLRPRGSTIPAELRARLTVALETPNSSIASSIPGYFPVWLKASAKKAAIRKAVLLPPAVLLLLAASSAFLRSCAYLPSGSVFQRCAAFCPPFRPMVASALRSLLVTRPGALAPSLVLVLVCVTYPRTRRAMVCRSRIGGISLSRPAPPCCCATL